MIDDADLSGGNVIARFDPSLGDGARYFVQSCFDHTFRREPSFRERRNTFDFEAQSRFRIIPRNEITAGAGYRWTSDRVGSVDSIRFVPANRRSDLLSAFVQDEIELVADVLYLALGVKIEDDEYSGLEVQPSGRALWRIDERQNVWAAVSRAVRTLPASRTTSRSTRSSRADRSRASSVTADSSPRKSSRTKRDTAFSP